MNSSGPEIKKEQSSKSLNSEKSMVNHSEYIYQLPSWDLLPPATFVVRRVHRL